MSQPGKQSECRCFVLLLVVAAGRVVTRLVFSGFSLPTNMSLTVQKVVTDAKNIAVKLKERNNAADILLLQGHTIHKKIDIMKQYADDAADLNETARHRPHSVLIAGIQQENRHLRDLQQENKELRAALEEQQNALELIMSKYRQQLSRFVHTSNLDLPKLYNDRYTDTVLEQSVKINEMTAVIGKAVEVDEEEFVKNEEQLKKLNIENENLRKLLKINGTCVSSKTLQENKTSDTMYSSHGCL